MSGEMAADPALDAAVRLHQAGELDRAARAYRAILDQHPDHANALHLLGVAELQMGRAAQAVELIARAIELRPGAGPYHLNHAAALRALGRIDDAIAAAEKAIALARQPADAARGYHVAGLAFADDSQAADAIFCWQKAVELDPTFTDVQVLLGRALRKVGQVEPAVASLRKAAELLPGDAIVRQELGAALRDHGDYDAAIAALDEALRLNPILPHALVEKGWALMDTRRYQRAAEAFRAALSQRPSASGHMGAGAAQARLGQVEQAVAHHRAAVRLEPSNAAAHSALLLTLQYPGTIAARELFEEHRAWDRRHAAPLGGAIEPHANGRDPDRPLRVGFISADFCSHPVARFMEPVLAHCERANFTFICYSATRRPDAATDRLRALAGEWHEIAALDFAQLAGRIRADAIDILVDLAGHTASNYLLTFARRPAPIQCTHFGYPDTTGMTAIDYRLSDALADPPGTTEPFHTETLARLPQIAWCYAAPPGIAEPNVRPEEEDDAAAVTFGSVNNLAKITPAVLRVWQRVLDAVPGSRLLLLTTSNEIEFTAEHLRRHGVETSRVEIVPPQTVPEYFRLFHRIDIALDPWPYNGGVTTCDTLWMGVPVVTLAGNRYVSRQGLALLTQVGLQDLIASSADDYVRIAAGLANDRARRVHLRATLRATMARSPICDGAAFTSALMAFYRDAWRTWCGAR